MQDQPSSPLLSVAVPVYNHGEFVKRALDSIFMQKTNFDFEVIIGDDFSTDQTREVIKEYKLKYPDQIILLLNDQNTGVVNNAINIYKNCKGKYIAVLEGDDYWLDENKLQVQVDFLELNADYSGCFHDAQILNISNQHAEQKESYYTGYKYYSQFNHFKTDFYPYDLLQRNIIPTASLVFRNKDYSDFFHQFREVHLSLQWAMHLYIIKGSRFRYFNQVWSVYTDHARGVTKMNEPEAFNKSDLQILKILRKDDYYKYYRVDLNRSILNEYKEILFQAESKKISFSSFLKYYLKYVQYTHKLFFAESAYFNRLRRNKK